MIRELGNMDKMQITVATVHGKVYSKRDTTSTPFGEHAVAFWDKEDLVILPMSQVERVTLHFEE